MNSSYYAKKFVGSLQRAVKVVLNNRKSTIGIIILLGFAFVAVFGRQLVDFDPTTNENLKFLAPSSKHWLGTDNLGRDVFKQLIYGAQDVLTIAFLTSVFAVFIGVTLGMISGFIGGAVDRVIQVITNLFLSIPSFPILLILASFITIEDALTFALILSLWNWAGLCRAVRSQIMSLKQRDFIQICIVMNLSKRHILFSELAPNVASYVLINFVLIMRSAITGSVGIMMLGLAAFQPSNWGAMLMRARDTGALLIPEAIYFVLAPIVAIMLFQMGAILFASGLDEALNPRLRRSS